MNSSLNSHSNSQKKESVDYKYVYLAEVPGVARGIKKKIEEK